MREKIFKQGFLKSVEYGSVRIALKLFLWLASFMSLRALRNLSRVLGDISYFLIFRHRRRTIINMRLVYGDEKSLPEIKRMTRQIFRNLCRYVCEMVYFCSRDKIEKSTILVDAVEGEEYLRQAYEKNKGAIIITAHFGNFLFIGKKLSDMGYRTASIMRQMKDEKLEELLAKWRNEKMGSHTILKLPLSKSVRESIDWLRKGNILVMYIDQRSGSGIWVDFLGMPTLTATGAAVFALRTGVPVLPLFILNYRGGCYKMIIEPPLKIIDNTGDRKKDIAANTARFTKVIEAYIRKYPTQWFWVHNRWKEKGY